MVNKIEIPMFDGIDYAFWKTKMEGFLAYCGYEIENSIQNQYVSPANGPSIVDEIKAYEINNKERFIIVNILSHFELIKVVNLKTAKEVWDKLEKMYEGDEKVKQEKLQNLEAQFEILRMGEDENIKSYM